MLLLYRVLSVVLHAVLNATVLRDAVLYVGVLSAAVLSAAMLLQGLLVVGFGGDMANLLAECQLEIDGKVLYKSWHQ